MSLESFSWFLSCKKNQKQKPFLSFLLSDENSGKELEGSRWVKKVQFITKIKRANTKWSNESQQDNTWRVLQRHQNRIF